MNWECGSTPNPPAIPTLVSCFHVPDGEQSVWCNFGGHCELRYVQALQLGVAEAPPHTKK